jgi:Tfp pilus assembly protein PilF
MIDRAIDQAAAAFVNAGRARLTSGDSNAAAGLFLRAQLLAPGKLAAVVNHALCYQQQPKALRFFRWASILSPGHPTVLANIGAWFARTSDCSGMLQAYRRLALVAPADARANNGLAKAWLVGVDQNGQVYGDQKRIDDCLRRTGVLTPDDLQARILRAQILMRTNAVSDARAIIEPLIFETDMQTQAMVVERLEPNFLVLLAEELWQHEQQTRAVDCLDLVLQHHPHNLVAVKVKARCLRLQGDDKLSRDLFRSVLVRDPQDRVGVLGVKESLVKLNALGSADRYFRHLNVLKPSNFLTLIDDWSVASFHAGKLQFSKKLAIRSIIASPGTLLRYQNFTGTLIAEQQLRLAERIVKHAECFGPTSATCVHKGLISLRRNALPDAARQFAKAIDIDPELVAPRFNRSLMHLKAGEATAGLAELIHTFDDVDGVAAQIKAVDAVISIASSTIMLAHATGTPAWAALRPYQDDGRFQDHCRESIWLPNCRQFWPSGSTNWQTSIGQISVALNDYFSGR